MSLNGFFYIATYCIYQIDHHIHPPIQMRSRIRYFSSYNKLLAKVLRHIWWWKAFNTLRNNILTFGIYN